MEVLHAHHRLPRGLRPPMTSSPMAAARCQHLLGLLAQVPDPRKKRGRRHALAGLLAVGIAAVIAGSKSFAAIGQWAGDAGPDVLAVLGAERGPAEESTYRRAFALVSADMLDRVLGAWLWTRGRAGRRAAGDRDRRQDRPRREAQGREGPAPGRGPGARDRRGPRPGRRGREVQRDTRGPGAAEGVRRRGRGSLHD